MTSPISTHSCLTFSAPDSRRIISSRLPTKRLRRSASSRIVTSRSWRVSASKVAPYVNMLLTAPRMDTRGVRKSCEIDERTIVETFGSLISSASYHLLYQPRAINCNRCLPGHRLQKSPLIRRKHHFRCLEAGQHPYGTVSTAEGKYSHSPPGSVSILALPPGYDAMPMWPRRVRSAVNCVPEGCPACGPADPPPETGLRPLPLERLPPGEQIARNTSVHPSPLLSDDSDRRAQPFEPRDGERHRPGDAHVPSDC